MRDNTFLRRQLEDLLENQFRDLELKNRLEIAFGRRAKRRFGSIKMERDKKVSRITINGIFKNEYVPEEIIRATIAHELCHYAHGFCSPLKKKYKYPHQGGVVRMEMRKRGLGKLYDYEKIWTKNNWPKIVEKEFGVQRRRVVRRRRKRATGLKLIYELLKP